MKYGFMTGLALAGTMALGVAAADAAPQLGAWWSFNNSHNNDRGDGLRTGSGFYHTTIPGPNFDDGIWTGPSDDFIAAGIKGDLLLPVYDGFGSGSGVLIDSTGIDNAAQSTAGRTDVANAFLNGQIGAYIDVSKLDGNNNGNMSSNTWGSFAGTGLNRPSGTFTGGSLAITGSANNGSTFDIVVTDAGYQVAEVSWAARGTSTGYDFRGVSYTTDGETWVPFWNETGTLPESWGVETVDFAGIDGITAIRFTVDGATGNNGNNRFDNIQLMVDTYIPEPASLALMAVGGLMLIRRRPQA